MNERQAHAEMAKSSPRAWFDPLEEAGLGVPSKPLANRICPMPSRGKRAAAAVAVGLFYAFAVFVILWVGQMLLQAGWRLLP